MQHCMRSKTIANNQGSCKYTCRSSEPAKQVSSCWCLSTQVFTCTHASFAGMSKSSGDPPQGAPISPCTCDIVRNSRKQAFLAVLKPLLLSTLHSTHRFKERSTIRLVSLQKPDGSRVQDKHSCKTRASHSQSLHPRDFYTGHRVRFGQEPCHSCQHAGPKEGHQSPQTQVQALGLGALEEGHGWRAKFRVGNMASVQLRFNLIAKLIMCRSLESWVAIILNMKCNKFYHQGFGLVWVNTQAHIPFGNSLNAQIATANPVRSPA